jgi:hypothetical protein
MRVIHPIEELARVARDAGAPVIVDVVSGLGAVPFAFDEWGIEVGVWRPSGRLPIRSAAPGEPPREEDGQADAYNGLEHGAPLITARSLADHVG